MAIRVGEGTVVTLSYRLQTENGDVLEDRTPENPFEFQFGCGETLPAIESIIRGKTEGFEASLGVARRLRPMGTIAMISWCVSRSIDFRFRQTCKWE
ncbi:MAG: FKBP-type peptidyl-prolyl cis-trans isomerase [Bdellovibrionales bacterium]|nr:FKBP-type peptidyl-prolyl cis-trans isomerase [Bdellovibrionales bacterium]